MQAWGLHVQVAGIADEVLQPGRSEDLIKALMPQLMEEGHLPFDFRRPPLARMAVFRWAALFDCLVCAGGNQGLSNGFFCGYARHIILVMCKHMAPCRLSCRRWDLADAAATSLYASSPPRTYCDHHGHATESDIF